jgi:hypothetical protein
MTGVAGEEARDVLEQAWVEKEEVNCTEPFPSFSIPWLKGSPDLLLLSVSLSLCLCHDWG